MRIRWRGLELPSRVVRDEAVSTDLYGRFVIEPFEQGFGTTIGNSLRRVLLSSLDGAAVTSVPGSSAWYRGGLIVYTDELKVELAGVRESTLRAEGAVSEAVALELAAGARRRCNADLGVAITGVAGPDGGTATKPVGRVHVAFDAHDGTTHWRLDLAGGRDAVRARSVTFALDRLRRHLAGGGCLRDDLM